MSIGGKAATTNGQEGDKNMDDSRVDQIRQHISAATAALDDCRSLIADIVEEDPDMDVLDHADLYAARLAVNQGLFKARNAFAALSRLGDRTRRNGKVLGGPW